MTVDELHAHLSRLLAEGHGSKPAFTLTRDDFDQYQDDIDTVAFDRETGLVFVTQADVFEVMLEGRSPTDGRDGNV